MSDDRRDGPKPLERIEKLELADRPSRPQYKEPEPYRPVAPPGFPKWPLVLLLAIGAGVALWRIPRVHDAIVRADVLPHGAPNPIVITSEPEGVDITIDGRVVGQTPWAGDNDWHGRVPYQLSAPGYQPIKGFFDGEQQVTLDVSLRKLR